MKSINTKYPADVIISHKGVLVCGTYQLEEGSRFGELVVYSEDLEMKCKIETSAVLDVQSSKEDLFAHKEPEGHFVVCLL